MTQKKIVLLQQISSNSIRINPLSCNSVLYTCDRHTHIYSLENIQGMRILTIYIIHTVRSPNHLLPTKFVLSSTHRRTQKYKYVTTLKIYPPQSTRADD